MIAGLVLAGGESRRMGHDKALIPVNGKPAYLHFANLLNEVCSTVYISCRTSQALSFDENKNIFPIYDHPAFANRGPLTGILSWLEQWYTAEKILNLACDLTIDTLHNQASEPYSGIQVQGIMVVGCDYRNLNVETLSAVLAVGQTQGRICCYQNHTNGIIDPLVAYYPTTDLQRLFETQEQQSSLRLFVETHNACILPTNQHLLQVLKSFDR